MTNYIFEKRMPSLREYSDLRRAVDWEPTSTDSTITALKNSQFSICVIKDDQIIGLGRVVGDGGLYFYIQDVIVLPAYQRQGIGTQIMNEIITYLDNNLIGEAFIGLKSAEGLISFYERFGFSCQPEDIPGIFMVRQNLAD